jgi:hypothetical protein
MEGNTMPEIHDHDKHWVKGKLHGLPYPHKKAILQQYKKWPTRQKANLSVLDLTKEIAKILGKDSRFYSINVEDKDHKVNAKRHARSCIRISANEQIQGLKRTYRAIVHYMTCYQIPPPKLTAKIINNLESDTLTKIEHAKVRGVLLRANDESWWKPKLRKLHNRQIETISRLLNQVNKHKGIYASNITVEAFKKQWSSSEELLERTIATNEDGFSMNLAELSKLNVSNPAIRKAELMVRIRGFEDYAKEMGYSALFLTMTTPSKYHRSFAKSGDANPNWNGATPLDAQDYLNRTFQRVRASLNRDKITPFGFRIAEPHHDGTPHWHLLLFIPTEQQQALVDTFEQYCLEEDGDEHGAKQRRFKVEYIDPEKGSATGYVVKYVSKNIDGKGIDHDSYGKEAVTSAVRIKVWASCWGIRQFQQIGGVGVTQWRELRRLAAITDEPMSWVEEIRQAADESNWNKYTNLMGGVFCKRTEQLIRPLYVQKRNNEKAQAANSNVQQTNQKNCSNPQSESRIEPLNIPESILQTDIAVSSINAESHTATLGTVPESITGNCSTNPECNLGITETNKASKPAPVIGIAEINSAIKVSNELENACKSKLASACIEQESDSKQYKTNRYGDELMTQLKGIICLGVEIITRVHQWTLSQSPAPKFLPNAVNLEFCQ